MNTLVSVNKRRCDICTLSVSVCDAVVSQIKCLNLEETLIVALCIVASKASIVSNKVRTLPVCVGFYNYSAVFAAGVLSIAEIIALKGADNYGTAELQSAGCTILVNGFVKAAEKIG